MSGREAEITGKKYTVELSDRTLLLLTEFLTKMAIAATTQAYLSGIYITKNTKLIYIHELLMKSFESSLRDLLKEPLKDPGFRKLFTEYFQNNLDPSIKDSAEWLDEILTWG